MQLAVDNTGYKKTKERMLCLLAETRFFTSGAIYDVYTKDSHPNSKFIQGSDGLFDTVGMTVSRFKLVKEKKV
jgi:hypothetical protein